MYSTRQFTYDAATKAFIAEASTLMHDDRSLFTQVYPDAADRGFVLCSHKTGAEVLFVLDKVHKSPDGELTHWTLVPTPEMVRKNSKLRNVRAVVLND